MHALLSRRSIAEGLEELFRPPRGQLAFLDGLRALCLTLMIMFHSLFFLAYFVGRERFLEIVSQPALRPFVHGQFGCDIFFVLSGFLLTYYLLDEHRARGAIDLGRFLVRRGLRILPLYYVFLGLMLLALPLGIDAYKRINAASLWTNVLQINNFIPWSDQYMEHSWFIALTVQFSLLVPALLWLLLKLPRRTWLPALGALLGLAFVVRWVVLVFFGGELVATMGNHTYLFHEVIDARPFGLFWDILYDKPYTRFGSVVVGMIVAVAYHERTLIGALDRSRLLRAIAVISFFVLVGFTLLSPDLFPDADPPGAGLKIFYLTTYRYAYSIAFGMLILLGFSTGFPGGAIRWVLGRPFFYPIAQLSYGAYLFHPATLFIVYYASFTLHILPLADVLASASGVVFVSALVLVLTLGFSLITFLFVERPFSKLRPRKPAVLVTTDESRVRA